MKLLSFVFAPFLIFGLVIACLVGAAGIWLLMRAGLLTEDTDDYGY